MRVVAAWAPTAPTTARSSGAATRRYGRDVVKGRGEWWGHVDHMDRHHAGLETMAMIRRQIVQGDYG